MLSYPPPVRDPPRHLDPGGVDCLSCDAEEVTRRDFFNHHWQRLLHGVALVECRKGSRSAVGSERSRLVGQARYGAAEAVAQSPSWGLLFVGRGDGRARR